MNKYLNLSLEKGEILKSQMENDCYFPRSCFDGEAADVYQKICEKHLQSIKKICKKIHELQHIN